MVLGTIAVISFCILLLIVAWHYIMEGEIKSANAAETASRGEISGDYINSSEALEQTQPENFAEKENETQHAAKADDNINNETEEYTYTQIVTEFVTEIVSSDKKAEERKTEALEQKYLMLNVLLQNPSLPTGCEITSLTAALNYLGYAVDKEVMADKYLEKGEAGQVTAYEAFIGNPTRSDGYGCFAPVIEKAANKYLSENNSGYKAYNLTGTSLEDLYYEINNNHPVIAWCTIDMREPKYYDDWKLSDGTYSWIGGGHCVVITGYNKSTNSIYVMDPLKGNTVYDFNLFKTRYEQMFMQAVVIK